jgi:hypothetical protein
MGAGMSIEAMKLALEALEEITSKTEPMSYYCSYAVEIENLRVAIEQAEKQEPVAKMREMLEVQGRDGNWNYDAYMQGMYNGMEFMVALAEGRDPVFRGAPEKWLYTAPPQQHSEQWWKHEVSNAWAEGYEKGRAQREWQGLTDEEIEKIEMSASSKLSAIYLVEAQLKGKNYDKS